MSAETSPKANPIAPFQSLWYRLFLLFLAVEVVFVWIVAGPGNLGCGLAVVGATFVLGPAVAAPVMGRVPRQWFRVPAGERVLHRILGVGIFGWLLNVSGWNRLIAEPMRGFSGTKGGLASLEQSLRGNVSAHGTCFAIHVLLAILALFTRHPLRGALWMLLPGVVVHLYPVLLQRSILLRLQPLLDKQGACDPREAPVPVIIARKTPKETPTSKPKGFTGRLTLRRMNWSHSKLTDWGLTHVTIEPGFAVLDVGCGGGRTVSKLAAFAAQGKVDGIDYSQESVAVSRRYNAREIQAGRVAIQLADVEKLPFAGDTYDLVTAVETHFYWPDIVAALREIRRVLKPGGTVILIAEVYKGADAFASRMCEQAAPAIGMKMLTPDEHRDALASAGFADVHIDAVSAKGWITAQGRK